MASDSEVHSMELPEYAYPDDNLTITTRDNEAYGVSPGTVVQPVETAQQARESSKQETVSDQAKCGTKSQRFFVQISVLFLGLLVVLAVALAASALRRSTQVSNPSPVVDSTQIAQLANALNSVEARLNQTNLELEQSQDQCQEQVRMLSAQVAQLSKNVTQALDPAPVPTQPPLSLLQNCNTTIEQEITVDPALGIDFTANVNISNSEDSIITSLQCVRAGESDEFNPLIATLTITGNLARCFCAVLDGFEGVFRANPVTCGLQVTRCSNTQ